MEGLENKDKKTSPKVEENKKQERKGKLFIPNNRSSRKKKMEKTSPKKIAQN